MALSEYICMPNALIHRVLGISAARVYTVSGRGATKFELDFFVFSPRTLFCHQGTRGVGRNYKLGQLGLFTAGALKRHFQSIFPNISCAPMELMSEKAEEAADGCIGCRRAPTLPIASTQLGRKRRRRQSLLEAVP